MARDVWCVCLGCGVETVGSIVWDVWCVCLLLGLVGGRWTDGIDGVTGARAGTHLKTVSTGRPGTTTPKLLLAIPQLVVVGAGVV